MNTSRRFGASQKKPAHVRRVAKLASVALVALLISACASSNEQEDESAENAQGNCPTAPIKIVSTVSQWGDIARDIGTDCIDAQTVIEGTSVDPHEYEAAPGDAAKFSEAKVVIKNGLGYDTWADSLIESSGSQPTVVNAGEVVGDKVGGDPHIWYSPDKVKKVAEAIARAMREASPQSNDFFDDGLAFWQSDLEQYESDIANIKERHKDKSVIATEPLFNMMAASLSLKNATPTGYENAIFNESDPSPADIAAFEQSLRSKSVDVLIFSKQSENPTSEKLRKLAEDQGIPVVGVTETRPEDFRSFADWQTSQLQELSTALSK